MYTYYDTADHQARCGGCGDTILPGDVYRYDDGHLTCEGCLIADADDDYVDFVRRPRSHEGRQVLLARRRRAYEQRHRVA